MSITPYEFTVCALGLWRFANLLCNEDGPFDIFPAIRAWSQRMCERYKWCRAYGFNMLFECEYCSSMYTGAAVVIGLHYLHAVVMVIMHVLAFSAVVVLVKRLHEFLQR